MKTKKHVKLYELGSNVPVETVFVLTEKECDQFLKNLQQENLNIFFIKIPVEFGVLDASGLK